MLKPKQTASTDFVPDYGDLSDLNEDGLIKGPFKKSNCRTLAPNILICWKPLLSFMRKRRLCFGDILFRLVPANGRCITQTLQYR